MDLDLFHVFGRTEFQTNSNQFLCYIHTEIRSRITGIAQITVVNETLDDLNRALQLEYRLAIQDGVVKKFVFVSHRNIFHGNFYQLIFPQKISVTNIYAHADCGSITSGTNKVIYLTYTGVRMRASVDDLCRSTVSSYSGDCVHFSHQVAAHSPDVSTVRSALVVVTRWQHSLHSPLSYCWRGGVVKPVKPSV